MPILQTLRSNLALLATGALSAVLAVLLVNQWSEARHWHKQSDRYESLFKSAQASLVQTEVNYRRAADEAKAKDAANLKRVQAEQAAIDKERYESLETRYADVRARADVLRKQLPTATNSGGPGTTSVPVVSASPGSADEAALEDQLLATEQAIQLDELIKWVRQQTTVKVSDK